VRDPIPICSSCHQQYGDSHACGNSETPGFPLFAKPKEFLIIHPFCPHVRFENQKETWSAVLELQKKFPVLNVAVAAFHSESILPSYAKILRDFWSEPYDIILLEQDIVPTFEALKSLVNCEELLCSFDSMYDYEADASHPGIVNIVPSHSEFCDLGSFGFCKLSKEFRSLISFRPKDSESDILDTRLSEEIRKYGVKFHAHRPRLKHNH
jgi:hypothetical protein